MMWIVMVAVAVVAMMMAADGEGTDGDGDDGTGGGDGTQDPGAGGQGSGAAGDDGDGDPTTGNGKAGKTFTQDELNAILGDRLGRAEKKHQEQINQQREALDELLAEKKQREEQEMTELERAQKAEADAKAEAQQVKQEAEKAKRRALRADLIAEHAADLPPAFKRLVDGESEEKLTESIQEARQQYDELNSRVREDTLAGAVAMTDEQLVETYGDAGKAFAEARRGRPVNIGSSGNAGEGQEAPPPSETRAFQDVREQRGKVPEAQRKRSLVDALTGRT